MATYNIQYGIETLSELYDPFEIGKFYFRPWKRIEWSARRYGWIAERNIVAESHKDAFADFFRSLEVLGNAIAVAAQCDTRLELQPFIITKKGERIGFFRHSVVRSPVPLHFEGEEIESLRRLVDQNFETNVTRCLREAINSDSMYSMLTMLAASLEAIATHEIGNSSKNLQRKFISENILENQDLRRRIFEFGGGIRNQILHGDYIDLEIHGSEN